MDSGLVDLSLFTMPLSTESYHVDDRTAPDGHQLLSSTTWPPANMNRSLSPGPHTYTNKPLPKPPRRALCDFIFMDPKNNNKCILKRMKRVRLDSVLSDRHLSATPSAYATARSAYINPNDPDPLPPSPTQNQGPTLQERRNPSSIPQLTLPTNQETIHTTNGLPMIWLADEQMWLVADPADPGYGYYATGPEDGMDEWLPPYTESESSPSNPSSSDLSPVREQFMSLMEHQRNQNSPRDGSNYAEPRLSPLFQEAMQGVSMLDFSDYEVPSDSQDRLRLSSASSGRQYIPYRPLPHSNSNQVTQRSSRSNSQQPSDRHNLYIPEWNPPLPSFKIPPPRSESPALRATSQALRSPSKAVDWSKYGSEAEIRRQQERMERRRGHLEREATWREKHERRDSCYSDSGVSTLTSATGGLDLGYEPGYLGVQRASSARH